MEKEIFIIRHGQTDYNKRGIIQGSGIDSEINEIGRLQARAFHETYQEKPFQLVITSELQRTQQTVAGFIDRGIPWIRMPEINEISWGKYEGLERSEETIRVFDHIVGAWQSGRFDVRPEAGESAAELESRLRVFVDFLVKRPEKNILVCTHGRTLRCLMCILEGRDISLMDEYLHDNTGLYRLNFRGLQFHTALKNDLMHLKGIQQNP